MIQIFMSRTLKWVVALGVLEMTLMATSVTFIRWQTLVADGLTADHVPGRFWAMAGGMAFFPAWVSLGTWLAVHKHHRSGLVHARDTLRHGEITMMGAVAMAVGVQAWLAAVILGLVPKGEVGVRLVEALTGIFIMVAGNFAAKTSPPTGERAPEPAAWTRGMLRIGWIGVAAGLTTAVSAIVAPLNLMIWMILGSTSGYVMGVVWQRRAMHRKAA